MLKLLKQAIAKAPTGCTVTVTFHDNEMIEEVKCIDADELGIVIDTTSGKYLRLIPWTAIGVLALRN
jgi:hypothetical protein